MHWIGFTWTPSGSRVKVLSPGQTDKHCLPNFSNFTRQHACPFGHHEQTLLDKHIFLANVFETFQKHFFACHKQKIFVKHLFV